MSGSPMPKSAVNGHSVASDTKSHRHHSFFTINPKSYEEKQMECQQLPPCATERKNHLVVPLECEKCHKLFHNRHDYICHIRLHNPKNTKHCRHCDYSASTDNGLQIHVQSLHPEKCDVEAAESSQRDTTNLPMIGGMDVGRRSEKLVKCSVCQKEMPNSWMEFHLHSHVRTDWLRCKLCDFVSRRPDLMNLHVEKVHATVYGRPDRLSSKTTPIRTGYKECPTCKIVMHKRNLPFHRRSHDPLKLFQCDHCEYASVSFLLFKRHLGTHASRSDSDEDESTTSTISTTQAVEREVPDSSSSSEVDVESNQFKTQRKTRGRGSVQCKICQKIVSVRDFYQHLQIHDPTKLVDFAYCSHIADLKLALSRSNGSGLPVSSKPVGTVNKEKTQQSFISSGISSLDSSDTDASIDGSAKISLNFSAIGKHLSTVLQSRFNKRRK